MKVKTVKSKSIYRSSSIIMVNNDQQSKSLFNMNLGAERNFIDNEIEILKSRTTSELVIRKLLNSPQKDDLYILGTKKKVSYFHISI